MYIHMATDEVCELIRYIYPYLSRHVRRGTPLNIFYILHEAYDGHAENIIDILDQHTCRPGIEETSTQMRYAMLLRSILQDTMRGNRHLALHQKQCEDLFDERG